MRMYTLTDCSTGYICCILPCYGANTPNLTRPDLPLSAHIPLHLYRSLLERMPGSLGHHVFTDRCHTSYTLAEQLYRLNCHLTGLVAAERRDLPDAIRTPKFQKKSTIAYRRNNSLLMAWQDGKRVVTLLTNWDNAGTSPVARLTSRRDAAQTIVRKPNAVINYVESMTGVDRANRCASIYCFMRKSLKWWRKLFYWGLEVCLIDSYILYKSVKRQRNERPLKRLQYRKVLVDQLRGEFRQVRDRASALLFGHDEIRLNGRLHVVRTGVKKDCRVCSFRSKPCERHETTFYCDTCPDKPRLHLGDCFVYYHSNERYKIR